MMCKVDNHTGPWFTNQNMSCVSKLSRYISANINYLCQMGYEGHLRYRSLNEI